MRSFKYRILPISLLLVIFIVRLIFAGTTGKIAGKITDKETGEPLPGVNVMVKGTTLGATTDIEGYYVILQVPPGVHSVAASMVGYAAFTVNEVEVYIDQTTTIDIQMVTETIQMKEVTVTAERNVVKKDVSTSVTAIREDDIAVLPVTSVNDIASLQAGIEEGLVVRGGEADQLLFQIDGVTLRDPRNNQPISSIPLSAVQEISIEKGGFNAEYGQVRSGIINIISREGDVKNYFGSIQMKYSPATPKHFGISVFDPNSMWNRPYLDPQVAFVGTEAGWDEYTARQYPKFDGWNTISERSLTDDDPSNDISPSAAQKLWMWQHRRRPPVEPDYNIDGSFGGPFPFISKDLGNLRFFTSFRLEREMLLIPLSRDDYKEYSWSAKVNSDITNTMRLMLNATGGKSYNVALNADDKQFNNPAWGVNSVPFWSPTAYMRTPFQIAEITNEGRASRIYTDSWYSQAEVTHYAMAGKLRDFINPTTYYEVSAEFVNRDYQTGPIRNRDVNTLYEIIPGMFVDEAPFGFSPDPVSGIGDADMFFGGHSSTVRDSSKTYSYIIKADLESQVHKEHLIKTGVEFSYHDLNLNYALVNEAFGGSNVVKEKWNPYRMAVYIQDKIEFSGFYANIGVRMDLSNPNTEWVDVSPFDERYFSAEFLNNPDLEKKKVKPDIAFSPRLGISHPITEASKLYFNYGHFKQMPAYEEIFRLGRSPSGVMLNFGDPRLKQAKTISYELGYDHSLFDLYLLQISAFYNDISNQQGYTQYVSDRKGIGYYRANNNSYEDIRGVEITFRKVAGDWIRGFANFTYQVNTQGAFGRQTVNENPADQKFIDQNTPLLYQQKPVPQPRAQLNLTFLTPSDFGPMFHGIDPLANWALNILGEWEAGEYITYNPQLVPDVINNVQVTDYYNVELRVNKSFDFDFLDVMLFMEVRNLFNIERLSGAGFYDSYDFQYYMESLHLPQSKAYENTNIPGDDRAGDVRKDGVPFQPIEKVGSVFSVSNPNPAAIYFDRSTQKYMNYVNGNWSEVDKNRMDQILEDKAYIDMPNNTSFNFLNPRQIFFGINFSFKL